MNIRNTAGHIVAALTSILLFSGCANSPMLSDSLTNSDSDNVVGAFNLVKNGHAVDLNHNPLGNRAYIHVSNVSMQPISTALVHKNGEFEINLSPGTYVIDSVAFEHQGELIESQTNFRFEITAAERTYIGAMTLEVTLENSALGVVGTADRFFVTNQCGTACDAELSIMRWNHRTAQNR